MKKFSAFLGVMILFLIGSCTETTVINTIHADGSVTRRIEMRDVGDEDKGTDRFKDDKVPYDSTWKITDTIEINEKGDTIGILIAEKFFKSVEEINLLYKNDSGSNREFVRTASFKKKFHWFNTIYEYSENIEKIYSNGYPVSKYLNARQLEYFYLPDSETESRKNSADSLKVRALADSTEAASNIWLIWSSANEWKHDFLKLVSLRTNPVEPTSFNFLDASIETRIQKLIDDKPNNMNDSAYLAVVHEVLGDSVYTEFKTEADSAYRSISGKLAKLTSLQSYIMKDRMPGKLVATNGFIDAKGDIVWQVKSEFMLSEDYRMWAESKTVNTWAWVVSALFLLFVLAGLLLRIFKK